MQTCIATKEAFGRKIQRNQLIIYNSLLQFGHVLPFYAKKKKKKQFPKARPKQQY